MIARSDRRAELAAAGAALIPVCTLLFVGIGRFGIWDPWELDAAERARALADAADRTAPPLASWLIARSIDLFGVSEMAGRAPLALAGLAAAAIAFLLLRRFAGPVAGLLAALVTGTTPLLLFNARQMNGEAAAMATSALVFFCAASAAFAPSRSEDPKARERATLAWLVGLVVAGALATAAAGVLAGVAPPLAAVGLVAALRARRPMTRAATLGTGAVVAGAVVVVAMVARAVVMDAAGYSAWLGGAPRGGNPPTFEAPLELVFHAFAPWSALLLVAFGAALRGVGRAVVEADPAREAAAREADAREADTAREPDPAREAAEARHALALALWGWAALGYVATTLYTARYGPATFLPVVALAGAIALFLDDVRRSGRSFWPEAVVGLLFAVLVLRDYALYPESPVRGLALEGLTVPEVFDPRKLWAAVYGVFLVGLVLTLGAAPGDDPRAAARPDPRAAWRWVVSRWRLGGAARVWTGLGLGLMVALFGAGVACFVVGEDQQIVTSIVIRVGKKLLFVPLAVIGGVLATPWVFFGVQRLGQARVGLIALAGFAVGAYATFGFQPALSAHFSPREVYDTYNDLRGGQDGLAEYRVSGRAAAYYAEGETSELASQEELIRWLTEPAEGARRWAVMPADELASVNRAYRQVARRHLYVADARSARVLLVASEPIDGRDNANFIADAVFPVSEAPSPRQRVGCLYDERIELVGYDLELPQAGFAGAGQAFTITWHWRAIQRVPGNYKIFLHVDGAGNRLNGDHEPVGDRYPVRLWDEGDVILDRQTLTVPANYRPGLYTFFIGFYAGNDRLAVTPGDKNDGENRCRAGTFTVR